MLVDQIAQLVDESLGGRSDMCRQFSELMHASLTHLGLDPQIVAGICSYHDSKGNMLWLWNHFWVVVSGEIIDGNIDSVRENPCAPRGLIVKPYWGPLDNIPRDRRFLPQPKDLPKKFDLDVLNTWWPELLVWLNLCAEFEDS